MEKAKISVIQLFAMMFLFDLGTTVVQSYGITAGKDAWLAVLLGMCTGVFLFFIYYRFFRYYPNLPLTGIVRKIFGKTLGWIIGLLYTLFFLYTTANNVRDFGELLLSSTMPKTPLLALNVLLVLAICYVLYLGIEVFARTAELFIVILLVLGLAGNFLVLVSGNFDFHNLQPFLENGWKPIIMTAYRNIPFPFAQMLVFMMLLPYLNRPELTRKVWLSALISSGLVLCWTTSVNIAVLGVEEVERSTFPLLSTIGKVNLFEFIQRLDAIVVFTMLITVFFKASIFFYGAVLGIVDLFKVKNYQQMLLPIACILIFWSMIMASNYSEHSEESDKVLFYLLDMPLLVFVPMIMLLVMIIRHVFKKESN